MATNPKRSVALFCRVRIRSGYIRETGAANNNRRISYRLLSACVIVTFILFFSFLKKELRSRITGGSQWVSSTKHFMSSQWLLHSTKLFYFTCLVLIYNRRFFKKSLRPAWSILCKHRHRFSKHRSNESKPKESLDCPYSVGPMWRNFTLLKVPNWTLIVLIWTPALKIWLTVINQISSLQ